LHQYIDESQSDPEICFSIQNAFKEARSAINLPLKRAI